MNLANERSDLWKDIVDSVLGIIFFAVPHRGADAVFWARAAVNIYKWATMGFKGNKNFIDALDRNSPQFWQISNAFIQPASRVAIIRSFYETRKIAKQIVCCNTHQTAKGSITKYDTPGQIVDKDSAILKLSNEIAMPIQGSNHRDICKFSSIESQRYQPVRTALKGMIERSKLDEALSM